MRTERHNGAPDTADLTTLSAAQQAALAALVAGASRVAAATAAGVRPEQISRWRSHHPAFGHALASARAEQIDELRDTITDLMRTALVELSRRVEVGDTAALMRAVDLLPAAVIADALAPPVLKPPEQVIAELTAVDDFDDALGRPTPAQRVERLRATCNGKP